MRESTVVFDNTPFPWLSPWVAPRLPERCCLDPAGNRVFVLNPNAGHLRRDQSSKFNELKPDRVGNIFV